jgi:hypothetical protein
MATIHRIASEDPPPYRVHPNYSDETAARLRAYLASMAPLGGYETGAWDMESCQRGRALIERLALSAPEDDPPGLSSR